MNNPHICRTRIGVIFSIGQPFPLTPVLLSSILSCGRQTKEIQRDSISFVAPYRQYRISFDESALKILLDLKN
jgi:hypothetical protein